MSLEASPLLNSLVSDLEEGTVQELLAAERCTTESDKKDYVMSAVFQSRLSLFLLLRMLWCPQERSSISWRLWGGTTQQSGCSRTEPLHIPRTM